MSIENILALWTGINIAATVAVLMVSAYTKPKKKRGPYSNEWYMNIENARINETNEITNEQLQTAINDTWAMLQKAVDDVEERLIFEHLRMLLQVQEKRAAGIVSMNWPEARIHAASAGLVAAAEAMRGRP